MKILSLGKKSKLARESISEVKSNFIDPYSQAQGYKSSILQDLIKSLNSEIRFSSRFIHEIEIAGVVNNIISIRNYFNQRIGQLKELLQLFLQISKYKKQMFKNKAVLGQYVSILGVKYNSIDTKYKKKFENKEVGEIKIKGISNKEYMTMTDTQKQLAMDEAQAEPVIKMYHILKEAKDNFDNNVTLFENRKGMYESAIDNVNKSLNTTLNNLMGISREVESVALAETEDVGKIINQFSRQLQLIKTFIGYLSEEMNLIHQIPISDKSQLDHLISEARRIGLTAQRVVK